MIQPKKKLCNNCNTDQFIWKNDKGSRYCKYCWYKSKEIKAKPLVRKPINQKSKKMKSADQAYTILRRSLWKKNQCVKQHYPDVMAHQLMCITKKDVVNTI